MGKLTKLFSRTPPAASLVPSGALLHLGSGDYATADQLSEGVLITGATGSGKTSGSGRTLRRALLRNGCGFLVNCVKGGEAEDWIRDATAEGRAADIIHFSVNGPFRFNPFAYFAALPDGSGRDPYNLANLMDRCCEFTEMAGETMSGGENAYFQRARKETLTRVVVPLFAAMGNISIDQVLEFITSAPLSLEQVADPDWRKRSFCYRMLCKSVADPAMPGLREHDVRAIGNYWLKQWSTMDPKTRSNIISTVTSALLPFTGGILRELFCTTTNVIPDLIRQGAIIIVDLPVKVYGDAAIVGNLIWKYMVQLMLERTSPNPQLPPSVIWVDECQFLTNSYDEGFLSTARSSRTINVYLTQNLPSFHSRLRARDPKAATDSILGNFQTKIFHANTDPVTNQFAADLIGKSIQRRYSENFSDTYGSSRTESWSTNEGRQSGYSIGASWGGQSSYGSSYGPGGRSSSSGGGRNWSSNEGRNWSRSTGESYSYSEGTNQGGSSGGGWSEVMDYVVEPRAFAAGLRKGGADNHGLVDGVIVQGGRRFNTSGAHWLPCSFRQ